MTADESAAPREGSCLYYSLIYLSAAARRRLLRRLALINTLETTLHDVSEPQVARQKIHWWHEEIDRLLQGKARHPATQALGDELHGRDAARDALLALLGVAADQRLAALKTEAERQARLDRQAQAGIRLALQAVADDDCWLRGDQPLPAQLPPALGAMNQLLQLPRLLHRGYPVFSDELYRQFDLQPQQLARQVAVEDADRQATADRIDVQPLYRHATQQALGLFEQAGSGWPPLAAGAIEDTLPLQILSALRARQCRLWLKKHPDLLRERATLAPLHKLFIAWRCRQRLERQVNPLH